MREQARAGKAEGQVPRSWCQTRQTIASSLVSSFFLLITGAKDLQGGVEEGNHNFSTSNLLALYFIDYHF